MAVYRAATHCPARCANQAGLLCRKKGHRADTKRRRRSVGVWEYEGPGRLQMKTHLQTKHGQYPGAGPSIPPPPSQTYYHHRSRGAHP